jgi:asparagine synthase (glutamine-hydrolysing)
VHDTPERVTFFEGSLVDPRRCLAGNDAAELDRSWEEIPAIAEGQYVAIQATRETLELITDPVGMEQVYYARAGNGWLVANSVTLLLRVVGSRPLDREGASSFLCLSWVGQDRTLREGIRVVPGGQRWRWRQGHDEPERHEYFGPRQLTSRRRAGLDELEAALTAQVRALGKAGGLLECPLTAGKDSRLLAALVLSAGVEAAYFTAGEPQTLDVRAGQAIAQALGLRHEVRTYTRSDLAAAWEPTSRRLLEQTDGLVSLWYMDNVLDQPLHVRELTMQLWGIGGEIARGYWNHPKVILGLRPAAAYLTAKVARTHGGLVRPAAQAVVARAVRRFAAEALEAGFTPRELPDVFEARQSVPRGDGSRGRISRSTGDYFAPFCTRPWLEAAFGLSPARRTTEPLHHALLQRLRPDLHSPPLATPWRPQQPALNLAAMLALSATARVRSRLLPRPAAGAVHHASLMEARLGDLRARCLDRGGSVLWDLVSRERFERLTAPDGDGKERSRQRHGLYNVVTLFEYEALGAG